MDSPLHYYNHQTYFQPGVVMTSRILSLGQKIFLKLFTFDRNKWFLTTVCKSFLLRMYSSSYGCSQRNIIIVPCEFFTPVLVDGLLRESQRQQVSRTLLSIRADFNNIVVTRFSTVRAPLSRLWDSSKHSTYN